MSGGLPRVWKIGVAVAVALVGGVVLARVVREQSHRHDVERRLAALAPNDLSAHPDLYVEAVSAGEGLYGRNCATCHGESLLGDAARGVPKLTGPDWLYGGGTMGDLERTISHGIRDVRDPQTWKLADMPAFGSVRPVSQGAPYPPLEPQEIADTAEYVLKLSHQAHDEAKAARGKAEFEGEGECYDCHIATGTGDPDVGAPDLTDANWLYGAGTRQDIATTISGGRHGTCPAWLVKLGRTGVREVAAFVKSRSEEASWAAAAEALRAADAPQ